MRLRLRHPTRRGITLTEILISIMILSVGLVSLLTLFPIGLLRMRTATRFHRSTLLGESALSDVESRGMLNVSTFLSLPWYGPPTFPTPTSPFLQDTPPLGTNIVPVSAAFLIDAAGNPVPNPNNNNQPFYIGPGLPVAYDPLWWVNLGAVPNNGQFEGRFASGQGFLRADPSGNKPASAYGLQRLTNFQPPINANFYPGFVSSVFSMFSSPDDLVYQSADQATAGAVSPLVPQLVPNGSGGFTTQNDILYTWMLTVRQADANNYSAFEGSVVVFYNRPLSIDPIQSPINPGTTLNIPGGELVVEGIFGYSTSVVPYPPGSNNSTGFAVGADQTVLLRWPSTLPDPEIRVGSWIADVTYERQLQYSNPTLSSLFGTALNPYAGQRCNWYRISRVTPAAADPGFPGDPGPYRRIVVNIDSPLRDKTLLNVSNGSPVLVNAALVDPYVVNVFSKVFFMR